MMFSIVRLSDLEKDVQLKKENFHSSRKRLSENVQEKTRPIAVLYQNRKLIAAGLMTLVTAFKVTRKKKSDNNDSVPSKTKKRSSWGPVLINLVKQLILHA